MSKEKESTAKLLGEFCREVGVLVAVFGVIDPLMEQDSHATFWWFLGILSVGAFFLGLGIRIETRRD